MIELPQALTEIALTAHALARLLLAQPDQSVLFTNGTGTIFKVIVEPYLEDDDGAVWIDLGPA